MKIKFVLVTCILLFSRGCDFYSTSLWFFQENGMSGEMNPLTQFFGVGWNGLIITNIIVVGCIIGLYYHYCFGKKPKVELKEIPGNFIEYTSSLYFNRPDKFYFIFFKMPRYPSIVYGQMGYVFVYTVMIAGFIATFHNLSQFYSFEFYNQFRELVGRPLYVIYAAIALTGIFFFIRIMKREFKTYLLTQQTLNPLSS